MGRCSEAPRRDGGWASTFFRCYDIVTDPVLGAGYLAARPELGRVRRYRSWRSGALAKTLVARQTRSAYALAVVHQKQGGVV